MNKEEYRIMYDLEDTHWWYVGMRKIYFGLLNKFYKNSDGLTILDAGCGTGIMLEYFKKYGLPVGLDISEEAIHFCRLRGHKKIVHASVTALPFRDTLFDLIAMLDVIYHFKVNDDFKALRECFCALKKEGRIILQVPAYNFLRSGHDGAVHTKHRYTKGELKAKVEKAGFKIEKITYINTILFPVIALLRLTRRITKFHNPPESDLRPTSVFINRLFILILTIEAKLLKSLNFPFGLSVLCIARSQLSSELRYPAY